MSADNTSADSSQEESSGAAGDVSLVHAGYSLSSILESHLGDNNPFHDISPEQMSQIAAVLSSDEGKRLLQQQLLAQGKDEEEDDEDDDDDGPDIASPVAEPMAAPLDPMLVVDTSEVSMIDLNTSANPVFDIDDVDISAGLRDPLAVSDLVATFVSGGDAPAASTPNYVSSDDDDTTAAATPGAGGEDSQQGMTGAEDEEDEEDTGRKRGGGSGSGGPKRRSSRIQDLEQREQAEKIRQENLQREREALQALKKAQDGPGEDDSKEEQVDSQDEVGKKEGGKKEAKSYNMRTKRPQRNDGRVDYTRGRGRGRGKGRGRGSSATRVDEVKIEDDSCKGSPSVSGQDDQEMETDEKVERMEAEEEEKKETPPQRGGRRSRGRSGDLLTPPRRGGGRRGRGAATTPTSSTTTPSSSSQQLDDSMDVDTDSDTINLISDQSDIPSPMISPRKSGRPMARRGRPFARRGGPLARGRGGSRKTLPPSDSHVVEDDSDTETDTAGGSAEPKEDDSKTVEGNVEKTTPPARGKGRGASRGARGNKRGARSAPAVSESPLTIASDSEDPLAVKEDKRGSGNDLEREKESSELNTPDSTLATNKPSRQIKEVKMYGDWEESNKKSPKGKNKKSDASTDSILNTTLESEDEVPLSALQIAAKEDTTGKLEECTKNKDESHIEDEKKQVEKSKSPRRRKTKGGKSKGKLKEDGENEDKESGESSNETEETEGSGSEWGSEDDPERLWCICQKPYNNRFMLCCDKCDNWFHGSCVGVTKRQGKQIEKDKLDWNCPDCLKDEKKPMKSKKSPSASKADSPESTTAADTKTEEVTEKEKPKEEKNDDTENPLEKVKERARANTDGNKGESEELISEKILKGAEESKEKVQVLQEKVKKLKEQRGQKADGDDKDGDNVEAEKAAKKAAKEDKKKKEKEKELQERRKKREALPVNERCLAKDCPNRRKEGVYCSEKCVEIHAEQSLKLLANQRKKIYGNKPLSTTERVVVMDRKSGKLLTGPAAPTEATLKLWLKKHMTFEVLQPGSDIMGATSSLGRIPKRESKESQELKERRDTREKLKEKIAREKREAQRRLEEQEKLRQREEKERHQKEEPRSNDSYRPRDDHGYGHRREDSVPVPDNFRITCRRALHEALTFRADGADDVMMSSAEIKRLALEIEEEMFRFYNGVNLKYKNKHRNIVANLRDPKNKGLYRKVLNAKISPGRLVRFTTDQLASEELARWKEKEPPQVPMSISQEIKEKPKVSLPASVDDDPYSGYAAQHIRPAYDYASDLLSSIIVDTTANHQNHLFDVNCKICNGKMDSKNDDTPKKTPGSDGGETPKYYQGQPADSYQQQHFAGFYVQAEPNSPLSPPLKPGNNAAEQQASEKKVQDTAAVQKPPSANLVARDPRAKHNQSKPREAAAVAAPAAAASKPPAVVSQPPAASHPPQPPPPAAASAKPAAPAVAGLPPNAKHMEAGRHSLWKGQLHVPDMCMFYAKAYRISGPWEEIHKEMPQTLALVGRLSPGQVWDYLNRMKNSTTRAVCVLRFDVIRPQDAKIYADLFTYLSTRDRCGVVNSFSKGVKDMYVVPLPAEKPIPEVLLPFSGPGIPVGRTNLLLAVIVKLLAKSKKPVDKPVATPAPPVMPAALKEFPSGLPPTVSAIPSLAPLVPTANVQKPTVRIDPRLKGHEKPTAAASESLASPADLTIDADEDDDDDLPLDTSDPIVQQFARAKKSKLEVPKIQPIEPAKDAEDDLPYEPEGAEELGSTDMYDPFAPSENSQSSLGLEPPKSTAGNIQSNVTETKTSQPTQIKADSKSAPGVNLNTLISTMGATSSNPAEMTARMLATLAATGTGGIDQQRALLMALTKQVEEQKRELERRQEEQKKEIEQKQKTVTETAKVSTSAAVSEEVPPPPPPQSTAGAVASTAPVIDVPDIPLPPTTQHAKTLDAKSEAKSEPKPESKTDARKEEDGEPANENNEKEKVDVPVEEMKPDVKPKSFYKPIEEEPLACNLARSRLAKKIQKETKAEERKKKEESKAGVAALPAALQALLSGQSFENLKNIVASVSTLPKPAGSSSPMQNEQTNKSSSNIQADEEDELEKAMNNPGGLKTILKEKQDIEKKVKEELNDSLEGWQIEQAEEEERKKHRLREEEIKKAERKKKWEEKLRSNPNISLSLGAQNAEEDFDVINPHGDVDYRVHGGKISSAFDDSPPHCSQPPNWQTSMSVPSSQFVDKSGAHTTPGTAIFPDIPTTSSVQHPLLPSLQKKNEDRSNISIPGLGEAPGLTNASPISFAGLIPNTLSVPTSLPATHTMATSQAGASNTAEPKSKLQKMTAEELAALAAKQLEDESESQAAPASEDMDISKEDEQMEKETNDEKTRSSDKKHRKKRSRSEEKRDAFRSKKSRRSRSRSPGKHRKDKKKRNNDDRRKGKHYKLSKSPSPDLIDNADSQISESTSHRRSRSKSRDRDRRRRRRSRSRERRRSRSRDRDRRRSRSRERRRSRSRDRGRKRFYDHSNSRSDHRRYIPPPLDPVDPDEGVSYDPSQPFEPMSKPKSASGDKNSVPEVPLEPEENFDEEDDGELDIPLPKRKPPPKPLPVKFDSLGLPLSFHSGPKRGTVKSTSTYVAKGAEAKVEYIDEILQEDENKDSDNTERKSLLGNTVIKVIETRQVKQSEKPPVKKEDILTQSSSKEVDDEEEEGELDDEQDGNQCGTFAMGAFLALMSGHKPEPEDEDVPNNAPPPEDLEEGEIIEGPKKKKKKLPLPIFPEEPEEERKIIIVRKSIAKSQESGQPGITTQTSTTVQTKPEPDMAKSNKNKDGFSNTFEESKVTSDKNSKQSTKGISFKLLSPKIKSDSSKSLLPGKQAPIAPLKTETSEASEEVKESKQEQSTEPPSEVGVSEEKISKPQKYLPVDKSLPQIYTVHPETGKMVITYGPPPWISGDTNVDYSNFYFEEVPETVAYESPEKTDKDIREERRERIRKRDEKGEPSVASIMKAIADIRKNVQSAAETGQAAPAIPGLDAKWPSTSSNTAEEESKSYTAAASTAQQAETFWGSAGEGSQGVGAVQPRFEGGAAAAAYGPPSRYDPHTSKDRDGLRGGHAAPQGGLPPHTHGHDWRQDSDMSLFGQKDVDARVDLPRMQSLIAGTIREEIRAFRSRDVDLRAPPLGHLDGDERRGDRLQPPRGLFGEEGDGDQALPFGQTDQDYRMPPRDRDYRELGQTQMDRDYRGSAPGHSDLRRGDRSYPRDNDSRINDQDYRNVPPMYSERRGGGGAMPRGGARGGGYRGGRPSYGPPRGAGHRGGRGGLGHRSRGAPPRGGPPRGRDKW